VRRFPSAGGRTALAILAVLCLALPPLRAETERDRGALAPNLSVAPAVAGGNLAAKRDAPDGEFPWTIAMPASGLPGDILIVSFSSTTPLTDGSATLRDGAGRVCARATAFGANPRGNARLVALLALSPTIEPGSYAVEAFALAGTCAITATARVTIGKRQFAQERLDLDETASAIKADLGPERLAQIEALNRLLSTFNAGAPRFSGPFKAPVASKRVTATYGDRRIYRYKNGKKETGIHFGLDYGIPTGTPVFAAGDGLVVMAERRISTGWTVVVEHLPGVYSLYYHLDALTCSAGESVRAGTLVGRSGMTGLVTGPHLHLEWRVNGVAVSPECFEGKSLF
jgi:murein DD-endopeptidase MepM/ murein hydrolase activator NlpD